MATAQTLLNIFQEFFSQVEKIKIKSISLEEKMKELLTRITQQIKFKFSEIGQKQARGEIVVLFLAVLHLLRDKVIKAEQNENFGEIAVEKR